MKPLFVLCYTTVRPECVASTVSLWEERALNPERVRWVISTDIDREDCAHTVRQVASQCARRLAVINHDLPGNCVKGWNAAYYKAIESFNGGTVIIAVSDDFVPPEEWDDALEGCDVPSWWKQERVIHVSDGYNPDILTLPIATSTYLDQYGYLYHPAYSSMFCDTEFTAVAYADGVVTEAPHLLFEHMHPDCSKRVRDEHDISHSSTERYAEGSAIFSARKEKGFPRDVGPKAVRYTGLTPEDFCVYMQVSKDDFCMADVVRRLIDEGVRRFYVCIPSLLWSGKPVSDADKASVYAALTAAVEGTADVLVNIREVDVAPHLKGARSRIEVETRVRNYCLEKIREKHEKHILVVDSDELWCRGLLSRVIDTVHACAPKCIYTGMIPVIGIPAYPVEATDSATIYVGPSSLFRDCRSTFGTKVCLPGYPVIHFTMVRPTRELLIEKCRESGHYDDPSYDFEGWIENILPNIRPGMRNAHMYKPYNPWKRVLLWTPDLVAQLPESLKKALGNV